MKKTFFNSTKKQSQIWLTFDTSNKMFVEPKFCWDDKKGLSQ